MGCTNASLPFAQVAMLCLGSAQSPAPGKAAIKVPGSVAHRILISLAAAAGPTFLSLPLRAIVAILFSAPLHCHLQPCKQSKCCRTAACCSGVSDGRSSNTRQASCLSPIAVQQELQVCTRPFWKDCHQERPQPVLAITPSTNTRRQREALNPRCIIPQTTPPQHASRSAH